MRPDGTTPRSVRRLCEVCGETFFAYPSRVRSGKAKVCSDRRCKARLYAERARARVDERFTQHQGSGAGCWEWRGRRDGSGYGVFSVGSVLDGTRRAGRAHVIAWERATGESVPPGMYVCHTCDNRACTRNDDIGTYEVRGQMVPRCGHLFLGTVQDNHADMMRKGRHVSRGFPTACKNGHARTVKNTGRDSDGFRRCLTCQRAAERHYRQRRKAALRPLVRVLAAQPAAADAAGGAAE